MLNDESYTSLELPTRVAYLRSKLSGSGTIVRVLFYFVSRTGRMLDCDLELLVICSIFIKLPSENLHFQERKAVKIVILHPNQTPLQFNVEIATGYLH